MKTYLIIFLNLIIFWRVIIECIRNFFWHFSCRWDIWMIFWAMIGCNKSGSYGNSLRTWLSHWCINQDNRWCIIVKAHYDNEYLIFVIKTSSTHDLATHLLVSPSPSLLPYYYSAYFYYYYYLHYYYYYYYYSPSQKRTSHQ